MTTNEWLPDISLEDLSAAQTQAFASRSINDVLELYDAYILDVYTVQTVAEVPRVAAGEAPAPTPQWQAIVSDGVVTVDGFDPIVLSNTIIRRTSSNACQFYDLFQY